MATQALKDLLSRFNNGEINKEDYDKQKKMIILNMVPQLNYFFFYFS